MKKAKILILILIVIISNSLVLKAQCHGGSTTGDNSQNQTTVIDNSTVIRGGTQFFAVEGNCENCKNRIETAALSLKGVKSAVWNLETHILTVNLKANTTLDDVYIAVAKAGHDNELYKTADKTYDSLPVCCKYRK